MTARTSSSASVWSNAVISSFIIVTVKAFSFSGRWSMIMALLSATSSRISVKAAQAGE
jgi:hypothetical protein